MSTAHGGAERRATLRIAVDHPAFDGHFPGFAVFPGAALLDAALSEITANRGLDITEWRIAAAKLLSPVRPGDVLALEHAASDPRTIRFTIRSADQAVASGMLSHGA